MFHAELFDKINLTKEPSTDFFTITIDSTFLSGVGLFVVLLFCIVIVMRLIRRTK